MKKFKKYAPWLIAGGAIAIAIGVHHHYATKLLLELPKIRIGNQIGYLLPTADKPMNYTLSNGTKLMLSLVENAEKAAKLAA